MISTARGDRANRLWIGRRLVAAGETCPVALAIGEGVGVAAYSAEPLVAAITSGVGGFITTLEVQAVVVLRSLCFCGLAPHDA